jgi:hypothetical protein
MSMAEHSPASRRITVVTGLPRSGTSMIMQMLHAGGVPILADGYRQPDLDNPRGYFEFKPATSLASDSTWMPRAQGKALKLVPMLLRHLPPDYCYDIIFIRRDLREVIASQTLMKQHQQENASPIDEDQLVAVYERHLQRTIDWLGKQNHMRVLHIRHDEVLHHTLEVADQIAAFLARSLTLNTRAMTAVVDPTLYRQRGSASV